VAELLTPTLAAHRPRTWTPGRLPWRLGSQVYVAFLGGPVAVGLIAVLNGARLAMPRAALVRMALVALAGTVAGVAGAALVPGDAAAPRLLVQLAGVLTCGVLHLVQRSPDRVHSTFSPHEDPDDDYDSLVAPGLAAIVAGWVVQIPLVSAVEGLL
jgi:fatty acid desaturase